VVIDAVLEIIFDMLLGTEEDRKHFGKLLDSMAAFEQRSFVIAALHWLSKRHLRGDSDIENPDWWKSDLKSVSAAACCLKTIIGDDENRKESLMNWLTGLPGAGIGEGINIRRAAIAMLSQSRFDLESIMEKSFQQFMDQLYIKHAPTLQQDGKSNISHIYNLC
jgi:telomere length regulation protein